VEKAIDEIESKIDGLPDKLTSSAENKELSS
jgi:hypothetical protein